MKKLLLLLKTFFSQSVIKRIQKNSSNEFKNYIAEIILEKNKNKVFEYISKLKKIIQKNQTLNVTHIAKDLCLEDIEVYDALLQLQNNKDSGLDIIYKWDHPQTNNSEFFTSEYLDEIEKNDFWYTDKIDGGAPVQISEDILSAYFQLHV